MTYQRFEDLPVWKAAARLANEIYDLTDLAESQFRKRSGLKSQLERAVLSISNNIAEGFERGTTAELITFLYIARGSAGEVRSMLSLMEQMRGFENFKSQISDLKLQSERCSRQLRGWADKLQNSAIKGQRHLNETSKAEYVRSAELSKALRERERFLEELEAEVRRNRGF